MKFNEMKNNTDKETTECTNLKLLSEFKQKVLQSKYLATKSDEKLPTDETIAKFVAAFCLENNIKAEKFTALFRYQLVDILKKAEPELPNVQISARTGINRRGITSLSKTTRPTKDMLVLSYLKNHCRIHNTTHILKHGHCNSFESYCKLSANGTLTSTSIANELMRLGYLIDKGSRYQIILNNDD